MKDDIHARRVLLGAAVLSIIRAYRSDVVVEFLDGQKTRLRDITWAINEGEDFAEFTGVHFQNIGGEPGALRFFANEVVGVDDPTTGERIFRLPMSVTSLD